MNNECYGFLESLGHPDRKTKKKNDLCCRRTPEDPIFDALSATIDRTTELADILMTTATIGPKTALKNVIPLGSMIAKEMYPEVAGKRRIQNTPESELLTCSFWEDVKNKLADYEDVRRSLRLFGGTVQKSYLAKRSRNTLNA
uniref:Uncharacterized protein n=1 Tax=Caenorhabditis tropicalis TaxID=1561998 RepID=A0A1I7UMM6_9PELO